MAKYDHIDFTPPQGVRDEAEKGLAWRRKFKRGATAVGIARARDLSNGVTISPSTARRMKAYFDRHQGDKNGKGWSPGTQGFPSNGRIAWAMWGSDAGWAWAKKLVKQMDAADKESGSVTEQRGRTETLVVAEQMDLSFEAMFCESRVDRDKRVIENVALGGLKSLNGYCYSEESYKDAIDTGLYDQVPVYIDHAQDKTKPSQRSLRDLVGHVENVSWDATKKQPRGNIRVTNTTNDWVMDLVESDQPAVGMSQVVYAKFDKKSKTATKFEKFVSIDVVAYPATTTRFSEQSDDDNQSPDSDSAPSIKSEMVIANASGSYEDITDQLRQQARPFLATHGVLDTEDREYRYFHISIEATYPDYVLASFYKDNRQYYYKMSYTVTDGKATLSGTPKEVQVKATIQESQTGDIKMDEQTIVMNSEMSKDVKCPHCSKKFKMDYSKSEQTIIEDNEELREQLAEAQKKVSTIDAELTATKQQLAESAQVVAKWEAHETKEKRRSLVKERLDAADVGGIQSFVSEQFMEQLLACATSEAMDSLIGDRKELVESFKASSNRPTSTPRHPVSEQSSQAAKKPNDQGDMEQLKESFREAVFAG